jgi:hypothetical protein
MWRASVLRGPLLDSHRIQAARLGARELRDLVLAVPRRVRARGLVAQAWRATVLVSRKRDARMLGVRRVHAQRVVARRRHSRAVAVRRGYAPTSAALGLSVPPLARAKTLAVRKRHARALRLSARPLARAKALAGTKARATFAQSPNASSLVAQASHPTVLIARSRCAVPLASLVTFQASATPMESAASGPPPTSELRSLRVMDLGAPRRSESSFPRAATSALRASKEPTFAPREQIWAPRSSHSVLPEARTPQARSAMGLPTAVGLSIGLSRVAISASRLTRGRLPQSQPPRRASAALDVSVSVALPTRRLPVRERRRCEPMLPPRIARGSECCLGAG